MRALLQRVSSAAVHVEGKKAGQIDQGLLVLICAMQGDDSAVVEKMVDKIIKLRIFADEQGKMNLGLRDIGGSVLLVSQFTLAADTRRGNRPGFSAAASPDQGRALYEEAIIGFERHGINVQTGVFGADMQVSLINDGPVTIWLDL